MTLLQDSSEGESTRTTPIGRALSWGNVPQEGEGLSVLKRFHAMCVAITDYARGLASLLQCTAMVEVKATCLDAFRSSNAREAISRSSSVS
jgi:hypothetical protein